MQVEFTVLSGIDQRGREKAGKKEEKKGKKLARSAAYHDKTNCKIRCKDLIPGKTALQMQKLRFISKKESQLKAISH